MKKYIFIILITLVLISVAFSGCTDYRGQSEGIPVAVVYSNGTYFYIDGNGNYSETNYVSEACSSMAKEKKL